jgi:hypothetical protein
MMALGNVDNLLIRRVIPALLHPVACPNDLTYTSPAWRDDMSVFSATLDHMA